ncbi:hypothetical protein T4D_5667 [Trichinella pseudospiralis]|uniref:Uncharacterized protein n=1 Tax=Trichinella pseudospiralis TaxID=6337 RepID=A0A0V1FPE3_TRIPS|nr:hypothetical protein T4D_5667 [Trichinella pseudospiralis]
MDVIYLFHSYFRDSNFAVNDVEFKLTYQKDAFDTEIVAGKATILVSQKERQEFTCFDIHIRLMETVLMKILLPERSSYAKDTNLYGTKTMPKNLVNNN